MIHTYYPLRFVSRLTESLKYREGTEFTIRNSEPAEFHFKSEQIELIVKMAFSEDMYDTVYDPLRSVMLKLRNA